MSPHWGVQSRFCVIYICMSSIIVNGETIQKKSYAKMHGRNHVVQTRTCSKISFGSLKRSADYNFRLKFLILPSSGRLKPSFDTRIIHSCYALESSSMVEKEAGKKQQHSLRNEKVVRNRRPRETAPGHSQKIEAR